MKRPRACTRAAAPARPLPSAAPGLCSPTLSSLSGAVSRFPLPDRETLSPNKQPYPLAHQAGCLRQREQESWARLPGFRKEAIVVLQQLRASIVPAQKWGCMQETACGGSGAQADPSRPPGRDCACAAQPACCSPQLVRFRMRIFHVSLLVWLIRGTRGSGGTRTAALSPPS